MFLSYLVEQAKQFVSTTLKAMTQHGAVDLQRRYGYFREGYLEHFSE
jgi:hypothetical protein